MCIFLWNPLMFTFFLLSMCHRHGKCFHTVTAGRRRASKMEKRAAFFLPPAPPSWGKMWGCAGVGRRRLGDLNRARKPAP